MTWRKVGARSLNQRRQQRIGLKVKLNQILLANELRWKQSSRTSWVEEGDRYTRYFHVMAKSRQRHNDLSKLKLGENTVTNEKMIRDHIVDYFRMQFIETLPSRPKIMGFQIETLSTKLNFDLPNPSLKKN